MFRVSLIGIGFLSAMAQASVFNAGEHCVAYKTNKKVLVFKNTEVVGRNCDISTQVIPQVDGGFLLEVSAPILSFQSGEPERDKDVAKTLKADTQPNLIFQTEAMKAEEWHEKIKSGHFPVNGKLQIGGESFQIKTEITMEKRTDGLEADGVIKAQFKDFKIDPPQLVGGLVSSVKQDLELHFHIKGGKTLGIESITPPPTVTTPSQEE